MAFTDDDKIVIKDLQQNKRYGAIKLIKMFPNKQWSLGEVNKLLKKIDESCDVKRRAGSGHLDQRVIDDAVGELRSRLRARVAVSGGHCEHKL
jgi:hypothetical protein